VIARLSVPSATSYVLFIGGGSLRAVEDTRSYRIGRPRGHHLFRPLSGTFNYGRDSFLEGRVQQHQAPQQFAGPDPRQLRRRWPLHSRPQSARLFVLGLDQNRGAEQYVKVATEVARPTARTSVARSGSPWRRRSGRRNWVIRVDAERWVRTQALAAMPDDELIPGQGGVGLGLRRYHCSEGRQWGTAEPSATGRARHSTTSLSAGLSR
jgi:hypothetical protein